MAADGSEVVLLHLFFLLTKFLIKFTDIFDELNDAFEVVVVDAVFNSVFMLEGVEMPEEGFEKL